MSVRKSPFAAAVCPLSVRKVGLQSSPTRRDNRPRHQTAPEMLAPMTGRCLKLTDSDVPRKRCAVDGGQNMAAKHDSRWMKISRRSEPVTGLACAWRFLCHPFFLMLGLSLRLVCRVQRAERLVVPDGQNGVPLSSEALLPSESPPHPRRTWGSVEHRASSVDP